MRAETVVRVFEFRSMSDGSVFDVSVDEAHDLIKQFFGPIAEFLDGTLALYRGEFTRPALSNPV